MGLEQHSSISGSTTPCANESAAVRCLEAVDALAATIRLIAARHGELEEALRAVLSAVGFNRDLVASVLSSCQQHFCSHPEDKASEEAVATMATVSKLSIFHPGKSPEDAQATGPFSIRLPLLLSAVPMCRGALAEWLDAAGVPADTAYDTLVVASELVTNGVIHAAGHDFALSAEQDHRSLIIEVTTTIPAENSIANAAGDPDEHGRGLVIVTALVDEMTVTDQHNLHRVRCRLSPA